MKIYTAHAGGVKLQNIVDRDMGVLASPGRSCAGYKDLDISIALDNGAFSAWQRGYPFMADNFRRHLENAYQHVKPEFIVCPDVVAGGLGSLDFSMMWVRNELLGARLALAVQDGMTPKDITPDIIKHFIYIFVGGTPEWKWATLAQWVRFARDEGKKIHVGQVGNINRLEYCQSLGVDSVDSSNFARHDSFDVIDAFHNKTQNDLFIGEHNGVRSKNETTASLGL